MKKIHLLLIALIAFANVSYASFPVLEDAPNEFIENIKTLNYSDSKPIWGLLSLSFALLSVILIPNFYIMLIFALLSTIFGIIGLANQPNLMEIIGLILGVIMTIVTGSIVGLKSLFRDA